MITYLLHRVAQALLTVLGVSLVIFVLLRVIPGDPVGLLFTPGQSVTPEIKAEIRRDLGLDEPFWRQYVIYLGQAVRGDLGRSYQSASSVRQQIVDAVPATLELTIGAAIVSVVVGLVAGVISAIRQNSLLDYGTVVLASVGMAAPVFWTGLILILVFAINLRWFPPAGRLDPRDPGGWSDLALHLVLPSLALGFNGAALLARITRSAMLDVITQEYVVTARAKGLAERAVLWLHAFRNALLPIVTVIGLQIGYLLSGAVLTETVFNRPGIGTLLVGAISSRDYPVVQGLVLFISVVFVLINLLVDVVYAWLDPRIRYG
jgi:ABC-type dipeptide/oligopeptide/nickel transport system permease component